MFAALTRNSQPISGLLSYTLGLPLSPVYSCDLNNLKVERISEDAFCPAAEIISNVDPNIVPFVVREQIYQ